MMNARLPLAILTTLIAAAASAGPISDWLDRKSKAPGPEQVLALTSTLQNDANPSKRARAAEDLAHFDGQAFPEIMPALINSLQHDASPNVRRDAAQALGRLKPASQEAAQALDQAIAHDDSALVRFQARTSRIGYHPPAATVPAKAPASSSMPNLPSSSPPAGTRPLPRPPADNADSGNPAEPGKFLPDDDLPRLLPPLPKLPKEKKETKTDDGGAILMAPKREIPERW